MKKRTLFTLLLLLTNAAFVFAQGDLPCDDGDPDGVACPIDSWVLIFAALVLVATVIHLKNRSNRQINAVKA